MNAGELLIEAARILAEEGWCQEYAAVDEHGLPCLSIAPYAVGRCALGAMAAAKRRNHWGISHLADARFAVEKYLGIPDIAYWNDQPERTAEDVILALKTVGEALA